MAWRLNCGVHPSIGKAIRNRRAVGYSWAVIAGQFHLDVATCKAAAKELEIHCFEEPVEKMSRIRRLNQMRYIRHRIKILTERLQELERETRLPNQ